MSYDITGKISVIFDEMQISDKFKKREFVVFVVDGEYSELIKLEFTHDKCDLLNNFAEGQEVSISFNLKGRLWTNPKGEDKYFLTAQAWKIEAVGSGIQEADLVAPQSYTAPPEIAPAPAMPPMDDSSDIPFFRLGDFEQ